MPIIAQPQRQFRYWMAVFVLAVLGAGVLLLFRCDPAQNSFYPVCYFYRLTGLQCPGCGSLRALHQLSHGHVLMALHFNPLLVVALPFLAFAGVRMVVGEITGRLGATVRMRPIWAKWMIGIIIVFTILRNIPVAPFTYLSPP